MKELIILLPTLNEERGVARVIKTIPVTALKKLKYNTSILVVDGHSKDKTRRVAEETGAQVILQKGKGKGMAFKTALSILKKNPPDALVMLDADNTYNPKEMPQVLLPIVTEEADVVMGMRQSRQHVIGNKLLTIAANLAFRNNIKDLCTGYWAFNEKAIRTIQVDAKGFDLESDLFAKVNKAGLRITGVPVTYRKRIGQSKLKIKDAFKIVGRIIRNIRDWNPLALFGGMGALGLAAAFYFGLKVMDDFVQRGSVVAVSTAILTALLGITGFFFLMLGLLLDFLERRV